MPTCNLDRAMPTCNLDRAMPTCNLDRAMPTCNLDRAMPTCNLDRAMPTVYYEKKENRFCPKSCVDAEVASARSTLKTTQQSQNW